MSLSSELRAWTLASAGVFALSGIGWKVWTAPKVPDLAPTLDAINRPCGLQGKPCGTLADINKTLATVRGAVGTVETAGRHYDKQLSTLDKQEATLFQDIHGTAKDAHETLSEANTAIEGIQPVTSALSDEIGALHKTTDAATVDLGTLNGSITASKHLLEAYTQSGNDLDDLLKRKAVGEIMDHAAGFMVHADSISGNVDRVSTKLTDDFVTPKPWYKKIAPTIEDIWHIAGNIPY